MYRAVVVVVVALGSSACTWSDAGQACIRHSDCRSGYCGAVGTCDTASDAGSDVDALDASTIVPPLPIDAPDDAPTDGADDGVDAGPDASDEGLARDPSSGGGRPARPGAS